jgi:hypothetical protein
MMLKTGVTVIVVAAGSSRRMGFNKLLEPLAGMPVLWRSLMAFERCPAIDRIVVVAGTDVGECATELLKNYRFGKVDFLVSEHTSRCGALNTVAGATPNIFDTLGCRPSLHVRLPNWNNMHLFDAETAMWDANYANLVGEERVSKLKQQSDLHKLRFINYCQQCSFPEITDWVESEWLTTRMGWSSNHPSLPLIWRIFNGVAGKLGITITLELEAHPMCATDVYASTGIPLNNIDYEANNWKF